MATFHDRTTAPSRTLLPGPGPEAAEARTFHGRRRLTEALEYGFALLDALDLPPLALDVIDDAIAALDALDAPGEDLEPSLGWTESGPRFFCDYQDCELDSADYEHSLGAPENHPGRWQIDMACRYHVGSRHHPLGDQTHWSAGRAGDVEDDGDDREPEAGYDQPEGDDERDDDGLAHAEHDTADAEPWLGSLGHIDQTRWSKSSLSDAEHDATDCLSRYMSKSAWDAVYANRPALNALTARARALRSRQVAPRDPDTLSPVRPGVMWWDGPGHCNVTPVPVRIVAVELPNLVELTL